MSKFDDQYSNPFEDSVDVNPFAQAAQAARTVSPVVPAASPYVPPALSAPVAAAPAPSPSFNPFAEPAAARPAPQVFPTSTSSVDPSLAAREAELQRRLAELEARERAALANGGVIQKPKNWPPCYPLTRHAIDEDVQDPNAKRLVKLGYLSYILHCCTLTMNMVGALAILVSPSNPAGQTDPTAGANFGIAVVFFALGIPLSWVFWYRPLYNAGTRDRAALYLIFMCMFALNICLVAVLIIGIQSGGTVGFIVMLNTFTLGKVAAGIICIIGMIGLGCELGLDIYLIIRVYLLFRGRGGTAAVKKEAMGSAAQTIAENPQLAASVARGAMGAAGSVATSARTSV